MFAHFLAGALLFRRRGCRERLEQGSCRDDVLAGPGKHRGALSVFHYLAVDLARMGASASPVGAPPKLPLELCAFLLQLSLGFLQLFLVSDGAQARSVAHSPSVPAERAAVSLTSWDHPGLPVFTRQVPRLPGDPRL